MEDLLQKVRNSKEMLDLSYSCIGDDELRVLCDEIQCITSIKWLWLSNNHFSDLTPLAGVLHRNYNLKRVWLCGNQISDLSPLVEVLQCNPPLELLSLQGNRISDVSSIIVALSYNSSLEILELDDNLISDLTPLVEILQYNSILKEIWIAGNPSTNHIHDNHFKIIRDMLHTNRYNALKRNKTLFEMMLESGVLSLK